MDYQTPMTKESKHLTLSTNNGLYQFNFMPFGIVNATETLIGIVRSLLKGLQNIATYMDDMCIDTNAFKEQITLSEIFQGISNAELTIKP